MTTIKRCPHCNRRLPREMQFVHPDRGAESWLAVAGPIATLGFLLFLLVHTAGLPWFPQPANDRLYLGAIAYGLWLLADGMLISSLHITVPAVIEWLFPGLQDEEEEEQPHPGGRLGGELRPVSDTWRLVERHFDVPPEPERGALSKWLWQVVDEKVTFSQRGARTAIRDNDTIRDWAKAVLALWCQAGWCEPVNGWNGNQPDLSNGVREVDADMVRHVASHGQGGMIEKLLELIDEDFEARSTNVGPPYIRME